MALSERKKVNAQASKIGLYTRIVEGLEGQPAYLLVFAVSALFVLTGVVTSVAAIVDRNLTFGVLGIIAFALALLAVVVVVREVERNWKARASEDQDHLSKNHDSDEELVRSLKDMLNDERFVPDLIVGIARGGLIVAGYLSKQLTKDPRIPVMSLWRRSDTIDYQNSFNHIAFNRRDLDPGTPGSIKILIVDAFCIHGDTLKLAKAFITESIGGEDVLIKTAAVFLRLDVGDRKTRPDFFVKETKQPVYGFGERE